MSRLSNTQRLWLYRAAALLLTAALVPLAAVWAAPRLVMQFLLNGPAATALQWHNRAAFPPPVTAQSRSVVLPSPDLLYSVCAYDVAKGPVRVQAQPTLSSYWSIALYGDNSDNFFVLNDRQAGSKPVDLWLVSAGGNLSASAVPAGAQVVVTPSSQGFLLMRVLTGNYEAEKAVLEPARRTLSCSPSG